jgi:hypothetical protein
VTTTQSLIMLGLTLVLFVILFTDDGHNGPYGW